MSAPSDQEILLVMTTITDIEKGKELARQIINKRLAACCNIVPSITSIYRWQDEVCEDTESLLVIKTSKSRFNLLCDLIKARHPYQLPEIIALPITSISQEYLSWVIQETS